MLIFYRINHLIGWHCTLTWTLNMSGEWTPVRTLSLSASGLYLAHHTPAPLSQNS